MGDPGAVRGRERISHLRADLRRLADGQRGPPQRRAVDELRHDVGDVPVCAGIEDGDDVGVIQRRDLARFALEAFEARRIGGELAGEDLQRDVPVEPGVTGAVYLAHSSGAERGDDFVNADSGPGSEHGVRTRITLETRFPASRVFTVRSRPPQDPLRHCARCRSALRGLTQRRLRASRRLSPSDPSDGGEVVSVPAADCVGSACSG